VQLGHSIKLRASGRALRLGSRQAQPSIFFGGSKRPFVLLRIIQSYAVTTQEIVIVPSA
jgi:hypothetical protein